MCRRKKEKIFAKIVATFQETLFFAAASGRDNKQAENIQKIYVSKKSILCFSKSKKKGSKNFAKSLEFYLWHATFCSPKIPDSS